MPDESSIYGTNTKGEAVLRTSENTEGDPTSIYGVNSDGKACMRVSSDVTSDDPTSIYGVNGSGEACVRIEGSGGGEPINNQDKTITTNGSYTADEGYTGLGTVTVNVPNPSTGTKNITGNGTYDVTDFASANVNVPTTAPAHYIEKTVDANGKLMNSTNIINLNGVSDIDNYMLAYAYNSLNFPANTSIDLSGLTNLSGQRACVEMFYNCTGIISVNLSGLTTISGSYACQNMFQMCSGLTSVDLSALTTISGNNGCALMFSGCLRLTSVSLPALTTVNTTSACQNMFQNCSGLTSVDLSALTTISGNSAFLQMFKSCTSLATVYIGGTTAINFGTPTNQFNNMFSGCTQNIDVYAPAASQAKIETLSGYPNFGGTGTVTWHWRS